MKVVFCKKILRCSKSLCLVLLFNQSLLICFKGGAVATISMRGGDIDLSFQEQN